MTRTIGAALAMHLLLTACGDATGGTDADATTSTSSPTTAPPPTTDTTEPPTTGDTDGPDPVVAAYCEYLLGCGCAPLTSPDLESCLQTHEYSRDSAAQLAAMAGLEFDAECWAAPFLRRIEDYGCKTEDGVAALDEPTECTFCPTAHGAVAAGGACTRSNVAIFASDCAKGLDCVDGVCRDRCAPLATGEPCATSEGDPLPCMPGDHCEQPGTGTCAPIPGPGEPCPAYTCTADHACDGTACAPLPQTGEPCTGECATGLVCAPAGDCRPPGLAGEACDNDTDCIDGLYCEAAACAPRLPVGSACDGLPEAACEFDSACVDGLCAALPPWMCPLLP